LEDEHKRVGGPPKTKSRKQPEWPMGNGAGLLLSIDHSKVRVRNVEGKYLTANHNGWSFSVDRSRAMVFDYHGDETRAQLSSLARAQDLPLELVPVEPKDFLERCDACQQLASPSDVWFDGKKFLCRRCNTWRT
jgi:hypothetical protein